MTTSRNLPDLNAHAQSDFLLFMKIALNILNGTKNIQLAWVHEYLCDGLQRIAVHRNGRIVISLPPRTLKSTIVSVIYVAWLLGRDPSCRIICVSYSDTLASYFSREFRRLIEHRAYRRIFPGLLIARNTEGEITTTKGGFRFATSVGGTLTGRGADFLIIDDPQNADDAYSEARRTRTNEWFSTSAITRLDNQSHGVIIVVQQRLHEEDLSGYLLRGGGWKQYKFGVRNGPEQRKFKLRNGRCRVWAPHEDLLPLHLPRAEQEKLLHSMGEARFSAQYMQEPRPATGAIVKLAWLLRRAEPPPRSHFRKVVQSWDVATKPTENADWTVITLWGIGRDGIYYLLDVVRVRVDFPTLLNLARSRIELDRPHYVLIEDASNGSALQQALSRERLRPALVGIRPDRDKVSRLHGVTHVMERGDLVLPISADWIAPYVQELTTFPNDRYDDQVDSTSQFLNWAEENARPVFPKWIPDSSFDRNPARANFTGIDTDDDYDFDEENYPE